MTHSARVDPSTPQAVTRRTVLRTGGAIAIAAGAGTAWRRTTAHAAPPSDSILLNGDFEALTDGFPTGWRQFNTARPVTRVADPVRSGVSAVRMADTDSQVMGLRSAQVAATPGRTYEASVWVQAGSGSPQLYLEFWNAAGQRIQANTVKAAALADWQFVALRATAPQDAARASVLIYSSTTNVGDAVFDDAGLRVLSAAELLAVPNSDFELVNGDQPVAWERWGDATPYLSSTQASHSGSRSTHYATQSWNAKSGLRSGRVPVTPGVRYQVEAHTLAAQGGPVVSLEYWSADGSRLSAYYSDPGRRSSTWYPISTMATAPVGAVSASVMLYSTTAPTEIWYDDVAIVEVAPEPVRQHTLKVAGHPRYQLGPDDVTRLRGIAQRTEPTALGLVGRDLAARVVGEAEGYLAETSITISYYGGHTVTYPVPPTQPAPMPPPPGFKGAYPYWAALGLAIKARLDTLACAYTLTGRVDFATMITSYVTTLAGWQAWADPQFGVRADQFTGYVTQAVAAAYDQIHATLSDAERADIVETLASKGLDLIFTDGIPGGGQIGGTAPTLAMGGLVLLGEDPRADRYLTRAEDMFGTWLDFRMTSGQNEGFLYTAYSSNPMSRSLAALERVTGDTSLSRHPFLSEEVWRWMLYSAAPPASCAAFSDALAKGVLGTTLHYLNRFLGNGYAGWLLSTCEFADTHWDVTDKIYWYDDAAVVTDPAALPRSASLAVVGEAHLRRGFTPDHALLSFRAIDSSYGHNHYDQNSLQLAIGGAWIVRSPGYRDLGQFSPTTVFSARDGHSTLLVDGHCQTQLGQGFLDRSFHGTAFDHARGRAAGAYVRPTLSQFDRHTMRIGDNRFVIIDRVAAPEAHRLTFQLLHGPLYQHHVGGQPVVAGAAVPGTSFHAHNGAGELWGDSADGVPQTIGFVSYPGAEQHGLQLQVTGAAPVTTSTRITTLEAIAVHDERHLSASDLQDRMTSTGATFTQHAGVTMLVQSEGDLVVTVTVPTTGTYLLESVFMTGNSYGKTSIVVDDEALGGAYDPSYFALTPGPAFRHGTVQLTAGTHTVRYRSTPGTTGSSRFAVQSLRVIPAEVAEQQRSNGLTATHRAAPDISALVTQADPEVRAATFGSAGDIGWSTEWVVATEGGRTRQLADLVTDAEVAILQTGRGRRANSVHRLGAMGVTRLELARQAFVTASRPVDVSVDATDPDRTIVEIATDGPTTVEVRTGGATAAAGDARVRQGRTPDSVAIDVPTGRHTVVLA